MRHAHLAVALAAACTLTALVCDGCGASASVLTGCHFEITTQSPEVVMGLWVESQAFAQCKITPDRHDVRLSLQYQGRGSRNWTVVATDRSAQTPPPPPRRLRFTVRADCRPGKWRAVATITAMRGGVSEHETAETPIPLVTGCQGQ
jgi:hypothetical protein